MSKWQLSNRSRGWGATKCVMMQVAGFVLFENQGKKDLDEGKVSMCFAIWILMLAFAQNPKHCILHQVKREVRIEAGGNSLHSLTDWLKFLLKICLHHDDKNTSFLISSGTTNCKIKSKREEAMQNQI